MGFGVLVFKIVAYPTFPTCLISCNLDWFEGKPTSPCFVNETNDCCNMGKLLPIPSSYCFKELFTSFIVATIFKRIPKLEFDV
jgi:hypothetical protein